MKARYERLRRTAVSTLQTCHTTHRTTEAPKAMAEALHGMAVSISKGRLGSEAKIVLWAWRSDFPHLYASGQSMGCTIFFVSSPLPLLGAQALGWIPARLFSFSYARLGAIPMPDDSSKRRFPWLTNIPTTSDPGIKLPPLRTVLSPLCLGES